MEAMQKAETRARSISAQVLKFIQSNSLKAGDQLPTEDAMAEELGINRSTLREVYVRMLSQGLIVRQHGKGTFVGQAPIKDGAVPYDGFAGRIGAAGFNPTVDILANGRVPLDAILAREFGCVAGTQASHLLRLFRANGTPVVVIEDSLAPDVDGDRIDMARYGLDMIAGLRTQVDMDGAHMDLSTTALALPDEKANLLGLAAQAPALHTYSVTRSRVGKAIAVAWAWLNPQMVEINGSRTITPDSASALALPGELRLVRDGERISRPVKTKAMAVK